MDNDNLPALIDDIARGLVEARTIEDVLQIRDRAEALRTYALKHKAVVQMQNGAVKLVLLCERRIGVELKKVPRALARGNNQHKKSLEQSGSTTAPPTLAELGLTKQQSSEFQKLAEVDAGVIDKAMQEANTAGRKLNKSDQGRAPSRH